MAEDNLKYYPSVLFYSFLHRRLLAFKTAFCRHPIFYRNGFMLRMNSDARMRVRALRFLICRMFSRNWIFRFCSTIICNKNAHFPGHLREFLDPFCGSDVKSLNRDNITLVCVLSASRSSQDKVPMRKARDLFAPVNTHVPTGQRGIFPVLDDDGT